MSEFDRYGEAGYERALERTISLDTVCETLITVARSRWSIGVAIVLAGDTG